MTTTAQSEATGTVDFEGPYRLSIGGRTIEADDTFEVYNPATGEVLAHAPTASAEQLDEAVAAAKAAFPSWSGLSHDERSAYLVRYADALDAQREELTRLLTLEQGKPLASMATFEVDLAISWVREAATRSLPVETVEDTDEHVVQIHHVPLGVVGAITPWNFPILLALWKVAPCLITGNTMVLKPSPYTPLGTLRFGEIAQRVLPAGVLNVVTGSDDVLGPRLTSHPDIAKISFTGSTATGRKVMESGSSTLKRVTLELGGNDPAILLPGADAEALIPQLFDAAYGNSGQWCIAIKRLYVHESMHRDFVDAFVRYAAGKKVGDGLDPDTDLGPIQNTMQYGKLIDLFDDIRAHGYDVPLGGEIDQSRPGNFVPVTVVDNPPDDSRIVREEPFGPVLPILSYSEVDEVVARANDTEFGLGASVWGPSEEAAAVAARLESGTVWVNEIHHHGVDIPFGGVKQSGMGVEHGTEGLAEFTNTKTLMFKK